MSGANPEPAVLGPLTAHARVLAHVGATRLTSVRFPLGADDDAWWSTKLGLMEGSFTTGNGCTPETPLAELRGPPPAGVAPLVGRYHDGPQRCLVSHDPAGRPVYSGAKVPYGECAGALEVYYGMAPEYYLSFMSSPLEPLTVATAEDGTSRSAKLLADVHVKLMGYHAKQLRKAGLDPASLPPPKAIVMGNWIEGGKYTPGIGSLFGRGSLVPTSVQDAARKAVRRPTADFDVYVADQDYGYVPGWAVGSLMMAEKVLQAELGLPKPTWLNGSWYEVNILAHA